MLERTTKMLKAFAQAATQFVPAILPSLRDKPLLTAKSQLTENLAYADPSRLIAGKLFYPFNPSVLVTKKGLSVFDMMKADEQVKVALSFKKSVALAGGWEVESPEDQPEDWEVTAFVRDNLLHLPGGFNKALLKIFTAVEYGYSITEKVYEERDGKLRLALLKAVKPHYIDFMTNAMGTLESVIQRYVPGASLLELPVDKFVIYSYAQEFENWYGKSDLESAYRAWWVKDNAYKWMSIMLERYGMPPLFMFYNNNMPPTQVTELQKVLKTIQNATMGMIPRANKDDIEPWTPQLATQAKDVFLPMLQRFDQDIARAILMPSLVGFTPDEKAGSLARAKTHFDAFLFVVQLLQQDIAVNAISSQLIRPLVDLNFPNVKSYPIFRFLPIESEVRVDVMEAWTNLVQQNVVNKIEDDERHIRAMMGFPPNADAKVLPNPAKGGGVSVDTGGHGGAIAEFINREENRFERKVDFAAVTKQLDEMEAHALTELKGVFAAMRDSLVKQVEARFKDASARFIDVLELKHKGALQLQLQELLRHAFDSGREAVREEVLPVRKFAAQRTSRAGAFVPREALSWLNQKAVTVSGTLQDRIKAEVKQVLLDALKNGALLAATVLKLQGVFEPYVGDSKVLKDGEAPPPYRLETVVRTNLNEAYNHGRLTEMEQPEVKPYVAAVEYSAIVDERTTEICRFLDQKLFHVDDPDLTALTPPNHFNCRSVLVPVLPDEKPDASEFITGEEKGKAKDLRGDF